MISNFQVFVKNFFKFFIKQGYKDSNLEMTESESVALPFGDSPLSFVLCFLSVSLSDKMYYIAPLRKMQVFFSNFFKNFF